MNKQEQWDQAQMIFNSEWFIAATEEFDKKMMNQLKYGDPEAADYKQFAYMVKGVTTLFGILRRPLVEAEEEDNKRQQKKKSKTRRSS